MTLFLDEYEFCIRLIVTVFKVTFEKMYQSRVLENWIRVLHHNVSGS